MATQLALMNPYIAGKSLGGQRGFCGREDILRLVETRLRTPDQGALVFAPRLGRIAGVVVP